MARPVVAIGLDAADPALVTEWADAGHLPNLARLRAAGAWGEVRNVDRYRAETPWTSFMTGVYPDRTGYWGRIVFDPARYEVSEIGAYAFDEFPAFYGVGDDYRVCVFDVPQARLSERVNGLQALAWGAHSPRGPTQSRPARLVKDLLAQYGAHPALNNDTPNGYDRLGRARLIEDFEIGLARRTAICRDLLRRGPWDLFLTVVAETHSGGHALWHTSRPHPLDRLTNRGNGGTLLDIYRAVDRSLGEILAAAPEDAVIVVFSVHGMVANVLDVGSMMALAELMYRWNFPGTAALAPGDGGTPPDPTFDHLEHWSTELWRRRDETGARDLESPDEQAEAGLSLAWQPANWYRPCWPRMRAFAVPSYSDGYVRVNLAGRERDGIVATADYAATLDAVEAELKALRCGRSGAPLVRRVIRTRTGGADPDPRRPYADLVVRWNESAVTDTFDHPDHGRIGPVPYFRTGGHRSRGLALVAGPGIPAGAALPTAEATALAPTILSLMGAPVPDYMDSGPLPAALAVGTA